jgi:hypothetical protein
MMAGASKEAADTEVALTYGVTLLYLAPVHTCLVQQRDPARPRRLLARTSHTRTTTPPSTSTHSPHTAA